MAPSAPLESTSTTVSPSLRTEASPRLHGLDALRAGALLLGIVLHSLMPFVPMLPWVVEDSQKSEAPWVVMFVIHLFRMSLFMMLAGYFGRMIVHRRGQASYLRDRTVRILLPLVAFWPVAVLSLGVLAAAGAAYRGIDPPAPPADAEGSLLALLTPGQLWFLLVLFEIVLIVLACRPLLVRVLGSDRAASWSARVGAVLASPGGVLLVAAPMVAALLLQGGDASGLREPTTLVPELAPLIGYLAAFLVGWFLHASVGSLTRIARRWVVLLSLAVPATALAFLATLVALPRPIVAVLAGLACWMWVLGLTGLAVRHLRRERRWIRYLADASYWMYLVHLPLLVAVAIPLADLSWPILVKLLVTWVAATAIMLASYQLLVRHTLLGRWLNGRRPARRARGARAER